MKKAIGAIAVSAIAIAMTATTSFAQEVTLRFQHFISAKGSVPHHFMQPWADKIFEESGGRLKIELYPAMQLGGSPPDIYDQIRDGVIDGGWTIPSYSPGRFPEAEVFELPFMTSMNAEDSSRAAWTYTSEFMGERFGDVRLLAVHVHGPGVIHNNGGTIDSIDDFEGLKLRGPSRQANKLLEALGATPVGMPVPAFPESLSKGVVDGGVIPWEIVPPLKVHELVDSHTQVGGDRALYNTYFIYAMNPAAYEALPDDLKAVIDANSGIEASAWAGRAMDIGDEAGEGAVAATDNTIHTLDEAVVSELRTIGEEITQAWIEELSGHGLDAAALVARAQELIAAESGE